MTWLQAMVALALFAPGAVAPTAGLSVQSLSIFSTAVFAVGVLTTFWAGGPINRIGSLRVASLCAAAVVASMALATLGSGAALLLAGLCLGFAFGPETPASTALLGKLVTDERRALVFSVRQTGNQIGAVLGSLTLPAIAIWLAPQWSYAVVGVCAIGGILVFEWLRPAYAGLAQAPPQLGMRARLALASSDRRLAALTAASIPFSGMQLALNTYFVTLGVRELGMSHVEAGVALACAQGGGLLGRLGWGFLAMRIGAARLILVSLGLGMAVCAAMFGLFNDVLGKGGTICPCRCLRPDGERLERRIPRRSCAIGTTGPDRRDDRRGADSFVCGLAGDAGSHLDRGTFRWSPGAFVGLAILAFGGTVALIWGDAR